MKNWSKTFHFLAGFVGVLAVISLLGAWFSGYNGAVLGMDQAHLFNDTMALSLIAIWLGIATLVHQNIENKKIVQ